MWGVEESRRRRRAVCNAKTDLAETCINRSGNHIASAGVQVGDAVQAGAAVGRVKTMADSRMRTLAVAGPSVAVQVLGLDSVPAAGDTFKTFANESDARSAGDAAKEAIRIARLSELSSSAVVTLSTLATQDDESEALQRMNLVIKGDTSGSVEAVKSALLGLPQVRGRPAV